MRSLRLFVMFSCLAAVAASAARGQDSDLQRVNVPLSDPTAPVRLEVSLMSGDLVVEAHDGPEVLLEITPDQDDDEEGEEGHSIEGMTRLSASSVSLTIEERANKVTIGGDWTSDIERLRILTPRRTSAHLTTTLGGDIEVDGLEGELELESVHGSVTATAVAGSVVASATYGDITVDLRSVAAGKPMSFSTYFGDIDTTFPASFRADLKIKVGTGDVYSDFQIDLEPSPVNMNRESTGRGTRITLERLVRGQIGGGGPELSFETGMGSVYLRRGG